MFKSLFNPKYRFFKRKIKSVTKQIWEYEFKVEKSRQVREGVRMDRDRAIEVLAQNQSALKNPDLPKADREAFENACKGLEEDSTRYEKQMAAIDGEINGGAPSEMNPSGIGILEMIRSLVEVRSMYREYLKSL